MDKIQLKFLTNWGHPDRIGLTGIRFHTRDDRPLWVSTIVACENCQDQRGDLTSLLHGKTKTVDERYMWSCYFNEDLPVTLAFSIPMLNKAHDVNLTLGTATIWNYNDCWKGLDIGVKNIQIYFNSSLVYEGRVEKGCGNAIFDYGQQLSFNTELLNQDAESTKPHSHIPEEGSLKRTNHVPDWFLQLYKNVPDRVSRGGDLDTDDDDDDWPKDAKNKGRILSGRRSTAENQLQSASEDLASCNSSGRTTRNSGVVGSSFEVLDDRISNSSHSCTDSLIGVEDIDMTMNSRENSAKYGRRSARQSSTYLTSNPPIPSLMNLKTVSSSHPSDAIDIILDQGIRTSPSNFISPDTVQNSSFVNDNFVIPELPEGQRLTLLVLTTWGDPHYVGLGGIELFCDNGKPPRIVEMWAYPTDVEDYLNVSGTISNLMDSNLRNKKDGNLWLAPFVPEKQHFICMAFDEPVKLAVARVWNYKKSRIHSFRGVRNIELMLDRQCIFRGEILKSSGLEYYGDTILFTLDEQILEKVSLYDDNFQCSCSSSDGEDTKEIDFQRPSTGSSTLSTANKEPLATDGQLDGYLSDIADDNGDFETLSGRRLTLTFLNNWGDVGFIGLNGLEILNDDGSPLQIKSHMVEDTVSAALLFERLFYGDHVTDDANRVWSIPLNNSDEEPKSVSINFSNIERFSGMRIWNYNINLQESYKGVKLMTVKIDDRQISPDGGYLIRRAPGNCHFDFVQEIDFRCPPPPLSMLPLEISQISSAEHRTMSGTSSQFGEYEPLVCPCGFIFQLQLLSSWGDPYYIGLNGLEIFNKDDQKITLTAGELAAYPDSVNVLDGIDDDPRTPDKLIDGINHSREGHNSWLSPILPGVINRVYIVFSFPVAISMVKIWNYGKTPQRGVRDFALLVDDLLVYHGTLMKIDEDHDKPVEHGTVLFTTDPFIYQREKHSLVRTMDDESVEQHADPSISNEVPNSTNLNQALRPFTSLSGNNSYRNVLQR